MILTFFLIFYLFQTNYIVGSQYIFSLLVLFYVVIIIMAKNCKFNLIFVCHFLNFYSFIFFVLMLCVVVVVVVAADQKKNVNLIQSLNLNVFTFFTIFSVFEIIFSSGCFFHTII